MFYIIVIIINELNVNLIIQISLYFMFEKFKILMKTF